MSYKKLISVSRPSVGEIELNAVKKVFDSGWLGMGKWVFEFESKLKEFLGVKNVIAVNTGTTALHLALDGIGIKAGDEVIVPSLTFVGSIQPIIYCGARPVFCEVYPDTLNINVEDMRKRITSKTKAIMPVHYSGLPCSMEEILNIAEKYGLKVVEDAAHAFGAYYKGKRIGSFGHATCFSFDPIKNITCGEGGAIATNDDNLAKLLYRKRILGIDRDTWSRHKHQRSWFYNVSTLGFRYHMSNINAAIGLQQLKKINRFVKRKREIIRQYDEAFKGINGVQLVKRDYESSAPFNYIIKVKTDRDKLMDYLKDFRIDSGVNYIPNHLQPFFATYKAKLPVTEKLWKEIITLPLYYEMSDNDVLFVIQKVKDFLRK